VIALSLAEIAAATGGTVDGADPGLLVEGPVVVDSREVSAGALFVAVPGERVDGHDFAAAAVERGARAVLATRPVGVPAVVAPDTVEALGALAGVVVRRLTAQHDLLVVGVTGSQGKTSTKDLIAAVLETHGTTIAPPGSFNNEIGLPLTALRAEPATRYLVMEMGARGLGHIRYLCEIAPPRIGVVLNVGVAHVGEFGSREVIAQAKGELVEALPADGTAVLNADDPLVAAMASRTAARVLTFGLRPDADVHAADVSLDPEGRPRFTLRTPDGTAPVALGLHGLHHVANALAAAAVAAVAGMPATAIAAALSAATPRSRWRMEVTTRPDGVTVVNDAYNANPDSMRAALEALVAIAGPRRSWAVLGEMRELGESSAAEHEAVGRLVADMDITRLVVVGDGARATHAGAVAARTWTPGSTAPVFVDDVAGAAELLSRELAPEDVVLVKASRAAGLEKVAAALLEAAP
jgi:UDP-N-acetylmuramoyl-tripeptide--D-alanyl-D-alanine ligase